MPIYEYACRSCSHQFETLVLKATVPACPECQSQDLDRLLSLPTVKSEGTKQKALQAAKRRDAQQGADRTRAQREYEQSHDD